MEESGETGAIHVEKMGDTHGSGMDDSRPYPKGKHQYPGYWFAIDPLEGGGGYHQNSHKGMHQFP